MFSPQSGIKDAPDLVPAGTLAFARLDVRELKHSKTSGAGFLDVKLTIASGPYEKRVIFDMVMDPFDPNASEGGRKMGILAITRICEAAGIFKPEDPATYDRYSHQGASIRDVVADIDGEIVPIKVKIERGTDGHADKNKVGEWLTPNPASQSGYKGFVMLKEGRDNVFSPAGAARPAFGGGAPSASAPSAPGAMPGASWLTKPGAAAAPQTAGGDGGEEPDEIPF